MGANPNRVAMLDPLILKIEGTLAPWTGKMFSKWGRLTLLKSIFCSIPLCFLSFYLVPKIVTKNGIFEQEFILG